MDAQFVSIVEYLAKVHGKAVFLDAAKCKSLLNDYAKNEYKRERHLLLLALEMGAGKEIAQARELDICKKIQVRALKEDHFIDEAAAQEVIELLARVLRGERVSPPPKPLRGKDISPPEPLPSTLPKTTPPQNWTQPVVYSKKRKSSFFAEVFLGIAVLILLFIVVRSFAPAQNSAKNDPSQNTEFAEPEDAETQYNLGRKYANNNDHAQAIKWYRRAAEQGYAEAKYALGVMYGNGQGVARNNAEAVKWYFMAAEQGHEKAQGELHARTPKFEDYPSTHPYQGPRANVKLVNKRDYRYRTNIRATESYPVNFSGEYVLSTWGCGTSCESGVVVNARTGTVVWLPGSICCWEGAGERVVFRLDSRLLILSGFINEEGEHGMHFYELRNDSFTYLFTIPVANEFY
jgi:TPR repeat protein